MKSSWILVVVASVVGSAWGQEALPASAPRSSVAAPSSVTVSPAASQSWADADALHAAWVEVQQGSQRSLAALEAQHRRALKRAAAEEERALRQGSLDGMPAAIERLREREGAIGASIRATDPGDFVPQVLVDAQHQVHDLMDLALRRQDSLERAAFAASKPDGREAWIARWEARVERLARLADAPCSGLSIHYELQLTEALLEEARDG